MNFSGIVRVHIDSEGISRFASPAIVGEEPGTEEKIDFKNNIEPCVATDILDIFGRKMVWARYKRRVETGIYHVYFAGEIITTNNGSGGEYGAVKLDKILYQSSRCDR